MLYNEETLGKLYANHCPEIHRQFRRESFGTDSMPRQGRSPVVVVVRQLSLVLRQDRMSIGPDNLRAAETLRGRNEREGVVNIG